MKLSGDLRTLRAMILLFCMGICPCFVNLASAGICLPTDQPSSVESQDTQDSAQQSSSNPSTETKPEEKSQTEEEKKKDKEKKKSDHAGSFVVAPLPLVSPALGAGIIPVLGYITPIPAKDRAIEPSVIG